MSGVYGQEGDGSGEPPMGGGGGSGYSGRGGGGGYGGGRGGDGYGGGGGGGGGYGGSRGGYQGDRGGRGGGDRGGGRGGGRNSGSGRDGDWRCPNPSCGNMNFARRTECNKCGVPSPASNDNRGGYSRGGRGGGGYENNRGSRGNYNDSGSGGNRYDTGSGRGGSYGSSQGKDDGGYGQGTAVAPQSGNPPSYVGGPNSYPPSYGASGGGYDRNTRDDNGSGGRGGSSRYGGAPRDSGGYDAAPEGNSEKVKQCDENCGDTCDNARIYISNLPPDATVDELRELFGSIGQVARIKQKRGYKDQWPWSIKLYTDEQGNSKGDGVLSYEDPSAAHSAGGFFNNHELRGHKITVSMAEKSAPKAPSYGSGGRGNYGGDRRRDNNRDGGSSGPDRHHYGGNRTRPY